MRWVVNTTPQPLYPQERPGTHCIGGWVGLRNDLDRCGKSHPPLGFDPWTVQPVASRCTDYAIPATHNTEACSRNNCCHGKAINITYSECVCVLLVIQHVKCTRCIILSSIACLVLPYFPHYLINNTIFGKMLLNVTCVF